MARLALVLVVFSLGTWHGRLVDGNVAAVLANGFSTDKQITLAEQKIRQIPFKYFSERPSHGVRLRMSTGEFTAFVRRLASDFTIPKDVEASILDGLYAAVNREIVKEIYFSKGNPGFVTYGQVSTLRHNDGRIDLAHTIYHFSFQLEPDIVKYKKPKRFLGIEYGSKTKYKKVDRTLSDQDMTILVDYAKYRAFTNFKNGYAREITGGSCHVGGCH